MIADLNPYKERKDSRLPWLGDVPAHWDVRRNGRLFRQRNETGFPDLPILEVSLRTGVRVRDFDNSTRKQVMSDREQYKRARLGDIAYNMMRMWQGAVGVAPEDGLISPAYIVAAPLRETDTRYYEYLFRTVAYMNEVNKFSRGIVSDRNRLYWEDFKQMPSPCPPPEEQSAIVRFLDHADRRIRRYIRAKRGLIALLNEQNQAVIHQAVTRGLDPNVKLKPSGVEWLGDVPQHWAVKRLKWVVRLQRGYDLPQQHRVPGPYPVVSSGGIIDSHQEFRSSGPGVVMGRYGSTDAVFLINDDFWPHNTSLFVTNFQGNLQTWCYYLLKSISKADHSGKSAVPGVDRKDLFDIQVVQPPPEEQGNIVSELESILARIHSITDQTNAEIECIREYRTRLIADVVTGKLDVREAAAELPDELDDVAEDIDDLLADDTSSEESELDVEPAEVEA